MLRRACSSALVRTQGGFGGRCNTTCTPSCYLQRRHTFSSSFSRSPARSSAATASATASRTANGAVSSTHKMTSIQQSLFNSFKSNPLIAQVTSSAALPLIGNGAYLVIASGFLMTDLLSLRVLLVGGYSGLVLFHSLHAKPLKIPMRWSAVFVLVNAGAAAFLVLDQWGASLTQDEETLFEKHFSEALTRGQFYQLLQIAKETEIPDGTILTTEGQVSPNLYFILEGQAKVYHKKTFAAYVDQGGFVNDVAFQQQHSKQQQQQERQGKKDRHLGAYGTVVTNGDCKVLVWDQEELRSRLASRKDMDRNLKYLLSQHLMKSLLKQREARHANAKDQEDTESWYSASSMSPTTTTSAV